MGSLSRREFLASGVAAGVVAGTAGPVSAARTVWRPARRVSGRPAAPVVVASGNGEAAVGRALQVIESGGDPLDGVIAGVNLVEEDPADYTVGYGGLPNALGVVQLDSCCMHGPTHRAGGVAALEGFKYPSRVARLVMEQTDHVLLVGAGARAFALENGMVEENLLTETSRQIWLYWRGALADHDDYLPPDTSGFTPEAQRIIESNPELFYPEQRRPTGTINCCAFVSKPAARSTSGSAHMAASGLATSSTSPSAEQ